MLELKIKKLRSVKTPTQAYGDAGIDFYVPDDFNQGREFEVKPHSDVLIPSAIAARIPEGHALIAMNKSGVATKHKLDVGACVVDETYQGEIHIHLFNTSNEPIVIYPGQKIVQFLLIPVRYARIIECENPFEGHESHRGARGFGSTGSF